MVKKHKKQIERGYMSYQTTEERSRVAWAAKVLQAKRQREHAKEVGEMEQRGANRYYNEAIRRGERPRQSIKEYETEEKESEAGREITRAKLRGTGRAMGAEVRRVVTSKSPAFKAEAMEGLLVRGRAKRRRVHLRYAPMHGNVLDAGRESNPWK